MKKLLSLRVAVLTLFVSVLASCDNEPLEGSFPINDQVIVELESGDFIATIDGNNDFTAAATAASITTDGFLTLTGANQGTGEIITLATANADVGSFSLNAGSGTQNGGFFIRVNEAANPFSTDTELNGSGVLNITELDMTGQTITGTFSFVGKRIRLDAMGNPINDSNGNPIIDTVSITDGFFNEIPFVLDDTGSGGTDDTDDTDDGTGGGNGEENMNNIFNATVEGNDFMATMVLSELATVADVDVLRIMAMNAAGETIRIDIPEEQGLGEFPFGDEDGISDGTQLFAIYNDGNGTANLTSQTGSITITDFSLQTGRIEATFDFIGTDPLMNKEDVVEVTSGSFTIFYTPNAAPASPLEAMIDDVPFTSNDVNVAQFTFGETDIETVRFVAVSGVQEITITFPKDITTGAYTMATETVDGTEVVGTYTPDTSIDDPIEYVSMPGEMFISSYNATTGTIEGTFSFTAIDEDPANPLTFDIAEGTFFLTIEQ